MFDGISYINISMISSSIILSDLDLSSSLLLDSYNNSRLGDNDLFLGIF